MTILIPHNRLVSQRIIRTDIPASIQVKDDHKSQLSKLLFGRDLPSINSVSFGWSKHLSSVETQILDVLTDPKYKSAIVASHSYPDGDAYGSNIGISGILESMGKKVHSVIDFRPKKTFQNLPSPDSQKTATTYIQGIQTLDVAKPVDIAVFTDIPEPQMLNSQRNAKKNFALDQILDKNPKKIIIIDHHPDQEGETTNQEKWFKTLSKSGVEEKNILYWRDNRASASEMVSELDQELVKESSQRKINDYKKDFNHAYRLSVATGIITDAGGTSTTRGEIDKTKFARLSYVTAPNTNISATRYDFEWLINNSGVPKAKIDSTKLISRMDLPPEISKKIKDVVNNKDTLKGIKVQLPAKGNPLGYVYIQNWKGMEQLADETGDKRISAKFIFKLIKSEMMERLKDDKNAGLYILANNSQDNCVYLTLRSYGYDQTAGELHEKGHVFGPSLAMKVLDVIEPSLGTGGGHKNACGFKSNKNVDFETQILPFVEEVVAEYVNKNQDLTKIPPSKMEQLKSIAFVNTFL